MHFNTGTTLLELALAHLSVFRFLLACFCFIQVLISLRSLAYRLELQNHKLDVVKILPCATVTYILSIQFIVARAPIKHVAPQAAIHRRAKYCCNTNIMDYTFFLVNWPMDRLIPDCAATVL